ncbi:MAG TPA: nitrilase-related carbon-nitrogen hydrolase [Planctomycetota bacterium]|nr:nitrilase-related carbon-nitrogen hydrolase [Planctomycetota bacterium]
MLLILALAAGCAAPEAPIPMSAAPGKTVRVGTLQPKSRLVDWRLKNPADVLAKIETSLADLEGLVHKAGEAGCDVVALPEDTLGTGSWEEAHADLLGEVLPRAVRSMLDRLGRAAAQHHMYLVCCSDTFESGVYHNTAFFLGRDGREIGRYHKVNMPIHELSKKRGEGFPVFPTPDLGTVGMLICYDMVFPEAPRCLALAGADIIFHPTLGGAAIGDNDITLAAFRTRAVDNFVYVVVSFRGGGSMIISPQGKVIAEAKGLDSLAIADIDIGSGRSGGDSMNHQEDMRSRLFRERSPAAFSILTDPNPPVLRKIPEVTTVEDAVRISRKAHTDGESEFGAADRLKRDGKKDEAIRAYERLIAEYPRTWIDRVSRERIAELRKP